MQKLFALLGQIIRVIVLYPLSNFYALGVALRNYAYEKGIFKREQLAVKIISVGNLSVGGTGKTPMAEFLVKSLTQKGYRVAYLSRGYGRRTTGYLQVNPQAHTLTEVGDEALQVARKFPNILVAVCENRVNGVKKLAEAATTPLDCVILDDAFQHRQIHRQVDIVMIDANRPPWKDYMLPFGRLREPLSALKRADLVVVNKILEDITIRSFQRRINNKDLCFTRVQALQLVPFYPDADILERADVQQRNCIAFSGLGNNDFYLTEIRRFGLMVLRFYRFSDHHTYRQRDIEKICRKFRRMKAQNIFITPPIIVTSEKDYMRLRNVGWFNSFMQEFPFYYLEISLEIIRGREHFERALEKINPPSNLESI